MALTDNLVAYYKLDESSGNAADSVGSLTLTNTGTTPYSSSYGKINNGILGNGSTQWLSSTSSPLTYAQLQGAFSVNIWGKRIGNPTGAAYYYRIENNNGGGTCTHFILYYYAAGGWHINAPGGDRTLTYTESGNMDMLTITCNGSGTFKFYVNGSQSGSNISLSIGTAAASRVGFGVLNDYQLGAPFNAQVDELGTWTRELSGTEVSNLYNGGSGLQYPFSGGATVNSNFFMFF